MFKLAAAAILAATPAFAQDVATYAFDGSFEDATFALESAIVGHGLVITYKSHVSEMLDRTGPEVGDTTKIFDDAEIYLFCSATLSREMMETNPLNIVYCPYSIFVFENDAGVTIGHHTYPEGEMKKVEAFLAEIASEAAAF